MGDRVEYKANSGRKAQQGKQYLCGPVALKTRITVHVDSLVLEMVRCCLCYTERVAHEGPATRLPQSLLQSSVPTWFKHSAHRTRLLKNFSVFGVLLATYGIFRHVRTAAKSDYQLLYVCPSVRPSVRIKQLGFSWDGFTSNLTFEYLSKSVEKIRVD